MREPAGTSNSGLWHSCLPHCPHISHSDQVLTMFSVSKRSFRSTAMPSHHHPSHASAPYPPSYPPQSSHPGYHPSSRHVSNGPPPPGIGGPGVPLGGPPEGPPVPHPMSNGYSQHTPHHQPPPAPVSAAARAGKEKQEGVLAQLANANENTWMLIGK